MGPVGRPLSSGPPAYRSVRHMARLIHLLRHAKSSRDDPALTDHERPLAPRGVRTAGTIAEHFRRAGLEPDLVLCSSAVRAVETLEGVRGALPPSTPMEIDDSLYRADARDLLERIRRLPEGVDSLLLVGHNPAIEELAVGLAGAGDDEALARMRRKYPTGALATLVVDGDWPGLDWKGGRLEAFWRPRNPVA
jgi:phosphohistidine phosphatase